MWEVLVCLAAGTCMNVRLLCDCCSSVPVNLPQPSILSCSASWYDFGDEDAGVVAHMRVVCSSCYAEAQA